MVDARSSLRLIGYWWSHDAPEWPRPQDWSDPYWSLEERDLVALYLESGQHMPYATAGLSLCRLCDKPNGSLEFTDGVFLWPQGLAHYVREHSVRLPDEIIKRAQQWAEPMNWEVDLTWWREQKARG
ncbi:hypothetical protein GCM10022224_017170 [Nonomuraea antimicrobica]|uniref:Uncharacterized protein n=1 Tax=Nonomuraea antimicrobica TaxID=561173 RepID=A0ABP7BCG3_9ACTN